MITPFQRAINRLREIARGAKRHGSCGKGVGECMADALAYGDAVLFAGDLTDPVRLRKKLQFMRAAKNQELAALLPLLPSSDAVRRECAALTDAGCLEDCCEVYRYFSSRVEIVDEAAIQAIFARPGTLLFEGAQGVLLDENYGFAPYTTWSTTTAANAETLLRENDYAGSIFRLGVMRTYTTRHGAGPFPTEDDELTRLMPEAHNGWNEWQREFRAGYCDLVAARYARDVVGAIDGLAVTHVDRLALPPRLPLSRDTAALTSCFDHTGNQILAIRVHQPPDLAHQENLTGMLGLCVPEYQELPLSSSQVMTEDDQMACCSFIAESLTLPLAITSHGPTASDKLCVVNIMPGSDSSLA